MVKPTVDYRSRFVTINFLFIAGVLLLSPVAGQEKTPPLSTPPQPKAAEITVETVQTRLKQVEGAKDLDDGVKPKAVQLYNQALQQLLSVDDLRKKAAGFKELRENAPDKSAKLKQLLSKPPAELKTEILPEAKVVQLEQRMSAAVEELATAEKALAQIEAEPKRRADRRIEVLRQLQTANSDLVEIGKALAAKPLPTDPPEVVLANQTLLQARKRETTERIAVLESELPTYDAIIELITLERDVAARRVSEAKRLVQAWQQIVETQRRKEADEQARIARVIAARAHPAVRSLANENERLAKIRTGSQGLAAKIRNTTAALDSAEQKLNAVSGDRSGIEEKLELPGMRTAIGPLLLKQRSELPRIDDLRRGIFSRQTTIGKTRLHLIEIDKSRREIDDAELQVQRIVEQLSPSASPAERRDVEETARELLQNQRELLDNLKADYTTYFNKLIDLNAKQLQLIAETETYSKLLDTNLLWIRSEAPLFPFDFDAAGNTLGWLADVGNWTGIGDDLWRAARTYPATSTFGVVVLLLLIVVQWWLRRSLHDMGVVAA